MKTLAALIFLLPATPVSRVWAADPMGAQPQDVVLDDVTRGRVHEAIKDHTHKHGKKCGHRAKKHGKHMDYLHDGHPHKAHEGHYDECHDAAAPAADAKATKAKSK